MNHQQPSELTITIKDDEKTMREKFLVYEPYQLIQNDPVIKDCIDRALKNFGSEPETIRIKASLLVL